MSTSDPQLLILRIISGGLDKWDLLSYFIIFKWLDNHIWLRFGSKAMVFTDFSEDFGKK